MKIKISVSVYGVDKCRSKNKSFNKERNVERVAGKKRKQSCKKRPSKKQRLDNGGKCFIDDEAALSGDDSEDDDESDMEDEDLEDLVDNNSDFENDI